MSVLKQRHEPVLVPPCTLSPSAQAASKSHKPIKAPKSTTPPNSHPLPQPMSTHPQTPRNQARGTQPAPSGSIALGKSALSTLSENQLHSKRKAETLALALAQAQADPQNPTQNPNPNQIQTQTQALDQALDQTVTPTETETQKATLDGPLQDTDSHFKSEYQAQFAERAQTPNMHNFPTMQSPTPIHRGMDHPLARRSVSNQLPTAPKQPSHAHSASVPSAAAASLASAMATPRLSDGCATPRAVVARKSHRRARSRIVAPIAADSSEGLGLSFDGSSIGAPPSPLASPQIDASFTSFYSCVTNPLASPGHSSDSTSPRVNSWPPDELAPLQDILVALARKERRVLESRQELADAEDDLSRFRTHINSRLGPTATRHVRPQIISRHALVNVGINSLSLTPEPEHEAPVGVWLMDESIHYIPPSVIRRPKPPRGGLGLRVVHFLLDTVRCIISVLPTYQAMPVRGGVIIWRPDYPSPTKTLLYAFPVLE